MSGNNALLDTNVIILLSKKEIDIELLLSRFDNFYVSIITYMETYGYEFENEEERELINNFFEIVEIVEVNISIAENVIDYRKNKKRKIKLPDAIILATAKYLNASLLSDDWDDFLYIDSSVNILNINDLKNKL